EPLGAVLLDILHSPLLAAGIERRDIGFLSFLVGQDAIVYLDTLGLQVWRRLLDGLKPAGLPRDTLRGCLLDSLLLCCPLGQFRGGFGLELRLLGRIKRVTFGLPFHINASAVVLDVAGRVAVQVPNIETRLFAL